MAGITLYLVDKPLDQDEIKEFAAVWFGVEYKKGIKETPKRSHYLISGGGQGGKMELMDSKAAVLFKSIMAEFMKLSVFLRNIKSNCNK